MAFPAVACKSRESAHRMPQCLARKFRLTHHNTDCWHSSKTMFKLMLPTCYLRFGISRFRTSTTILLFTVVSSTDHSEDPPHLPYLSYVKCVQYVVECCSSTHSMISIRKGWSEREENHGVQVTTMAGKDGIFSRSLGGKPFETTFKYKTILIITISFVDSII